MSSDCAGNQSEDGHEYKVRRGRNLKMAILMSLSLDQDDTMAKEENSGHPVRNSSLNS